MAVAQPGAQPPVPPTTSPAYANISVKYHGLPHLIAEDLRLLESFVDYDTHNHPLSRNLPRKT
jgi:hypothetical protein